MVRGWVILACALLYGCSGSPQANLRKGDELLRARDFAGARMRYTRAVRADRRYGPAYLGLGRAAIGLGDLGGADDSLRRAIELLPPNSREHDDAAIALADVYLRMDRHESRMQYVEKTATDLCQRDPNSYHGRRLLGWLALQRADLRHRIGNRQLEQFFLNDAVAEFAFANRVRPGQPEVMSGLARSLAVAGKLDEAAADFRALVALEPRNPAWYAELYRVLLARNRDQEAAGVLQSASTAMPRQPEFLVMRAAQAFDDRNGLPDLLARLADAGPAWYPAFLAAGDFWARAGEFDRARSIYDRCASQSPPGREVCRARILSLLGTQGRNAQALQLARQMLAENRDDVAARLVEARAHIDGRNLVNALNELQSIIVYDPRNYEARFLLARVHLLSGEGEQARQQLTEAIDLKPDFDEARLELAQLHVVRGEFKAALQFAGDVLARQPGSFQAQRIHEYAAKRVHDPELHGLWGPASDNVRRIGEGRLVMEGDPSDSPLSSADRQSPGPSQAPPPASSVYLRNTLVDDALGGYRTLRAHSYDPFDFTRPVPGVWPSPK